MFRYQVPQWTILLSNKRSTGTRRKPNKLHCCSVHGLQLHRGDCPVLQDEPHVSVALGPGPCLCYQLYNNWESVVGLNPHVGPVWLGKPHQVLLTTQLLQVLLGLFWTIWWTKLEEIEMWPLWDQSEGRNECAKEYKWTSGDPVE